MISSTISESNFSQSSVERGVAPILRVDAVAKAFKGRPALAEVSFELAAGELLVALGPSGCGKTTLLRIIAGLETADHGEIWLAGRRIDDLSPKDRDVSLVFQNYALYPHMSVAENLAFPLVARKVDKSIRRAEVTRVAELLDLTEKLDAKPAELSGGQRQRVALGRAIIRRPNLFLLDEPLSNLDAGLRARMRGEIVRLQKSLKTPALYVTHDQTEALTMADRILLLRDGVPQQIASPEMVYRSPANMFVASFVGSPKINLIPCRLDNGAIHPFGARVDFFYPSGLELIVGGRREFTLGIRPEDIFPGPLGEYKATVSAVEYLGDRRVMSVDFNGTMLMFFSDSRTLRCGDPVSFNIRRENIHFFDNSSGVRLAR